MELFKDFVSFKCKTDRLTEMNISLSAFSILPPGIMIIQWEFKFPVLNWKAHQPSNEMFEKQHDQVAVNAFVSAQEENMSVMQPCTMKMLTMIWNDNY